MGSCFAVPIQRARIVVYCFAEQSLGEIETLLHVLLVNSVFAWQQLHCCPPLPRLHKEWPFALQRLNGLCIRCFCCLRGYFVRLQTSTPKAGTRPLGQISGGLPAQD